MARHGHGAPCTVTMLHEDDNARLKPGENSVLVSRTLPKIDTVDAPWSSESCTFRREKRGMDPTIGSVCASDTTPVPKFSDDLNGKSRLLINPADWILRTRSDTNIRRRPLKGYEARKHPVGVRSGPGMGMRSCSSPQAAEKERSDPQDCRAFRHRQLRRALFITAL